MPLPRIPEQYKQHAKLVAAGAAAFAGATAYEAFKSTIGEGYKSLAGRAIRKLRAVHGSRVAPRATATTGRQPRMKLGVAVQKNVATEMAHHGYIEPRDSHGRWTT